MSYSQFNKQNSETPENYKARLQKNYTNIGLASRNASTEDRQNYSSQRAYIQQKLNNISSNQQQSDQEVSQNTAATVVNNPIVNNSGTNNSVVNNPAVTITNINKRKILKKTIKKPTAQTQLTGTDKVNYQKSLDIYNMLNSKYSELDNDFTNIKDSIDNYLTTLDGIVIKNINQNSNNLNYTTYLSSSYSDVLVKSNEYTDLSSLLQEKINSIKNLLSNSTTNNSINKQLGNITTYSSKFASQNNRYIQFATSKFNKVKSDINSLKDNFSELLYNYQDLNDSLVLNYNTQLSSFKAQIKEKIIDYYEKLIDNKSSNIGATYQKYNFVKNNSSKLDRLQQIKSSLLSIKKYINNLINVLNANIGNNKVEINQNNLSQLKESIDKVQSMYETTEAKFKDTISSYKTKVTTNISSLEDDINDIVTQLKALVVKHKAIFGNKFNNSLNKIGSIANTVSNSYKDVNSEIRTRLQGLLNNIGKLNGNSSLTIKTGRVITPPAVTPFNESSVVSNNGSSGVSNNRSNNENNNKPNEKYPGLSTGNLSTIFQLGDIVTGETTNGENVTGSYSNYAPANGYRGLVDQNTGQTVVVPESTIKDATKKKLNSKTVSAYQKMFNKTATESNNQKNRMIRALSNKIKNVSENNVNNNSKNNFRKLKTNINNYMSTQ